MRPAIPRALVPAALVPAALVLGTLGLGAVLLAGASCAPATVRADAPPAARPADGARAIAQSVLERMGGREAWEATRHVHWNFFGRREHWWDKATGNVRMEGEGLTILMNVGTREGRVFRDGAEVTDPAERGEALERGYAWWINDMYWVFMPYKLLDPGVHLADLGAQDMADGRPARALELSFEGVGLTPENRYVVRVADDSGLVEEWSYFARAEDLEPRFTLPWHDWQRFGRILLATEHGRGHDWQFEVVDELPPEVYTAP